MIALIAKHTQLKFKLRATFVHNFGCRPPKMSENILVHCDFLEILEAEERSSKYCIVLISLTSTKVTQIHISLVSILDKAENLTGK